MKRASFVLFLLWLGCARTAPESPPVADPASARMLAAGRIVGFVGPHGSDVYLGLPYAAPPVGALRWRPPRAVSSWEGTREALRHGSACPQFGSRFGGLPIASSEVGGNEDCLYLDVYAPRAPGGDRPVLVWIHGGGNVIGQAANYDGGYLAATQDLVVVNINYRLGPLGWFRHASLRETAASAEEASGNFGVLDMIAALQWVRENVAAFGGNPDNVTIFGESAGGRDVLALLRAPGARGLFHRAIAQSGGLRRTELARAEGFTSDPDPGAPNSSNEILVTLLASEAGIDRKEARRRLAGMSAEEVRGYLRAMPAPRLLAAYARDDTEGLIDVPQMFPDGAVLPTETPLEGLARPQGHAGVPVMIGTNRDEDKLFLLASPEHSWRFLWVLPRLRDPVRFEALAEHGSRLWKATGADEPAAALIEGGAPGVYVYRFDWDEEPTVAGSDFSQMIGAAHGFEIPFVFGVFDLGEEANIVWTDENEAERRRLSAQMISYWVNFARTGSPGRGLEGDLPSWRPAPAFLVLDTPADGGLRMSEETLREEVVLSAARVDSRLGDQAQRCAAYRALLARSNRHHSAPLPDGC